MLLFSGVCNCLAMALSLSCHASLSMCIAHSLSVYVRCLWLFSLSFCGYVSFSAISPAYCLRIAMFAFMSLSLYSVCFYSM